MTLPAPLKSPLTADLLVFISRREGCAGVFGMTVCPHTMKAVDELGDVHCCDCGKRLTKKAFLEEGIRKRDMAIASLKFDVAMRTDQAAEQGSKIFRLITALRMLGQFGRPTSWDSEVPRIIFEWLDKGEFGPLPWPESPFVREWLSSEGYTPSSFGLHGYRDGPV